MKKDRRVAILLPDRLCSLGLESVLKEYFSFSKIIYCASFQALEEEQADAVDFYFTDSDSFLANLDYFLPRRTKTMVLVHQPESFSLPVNILSTRSSLETLIEQLAQFFAQENGFSNPVENNKGLSSREINVLREVVYGYTNKEIADHLHISLNTVLTHRKNITAKLGIKTVPGLTFYAIMNGVISGDEIPSL